MAEGPETVPTCYRHPNRETHIRCTRCERPICPDCMISAAVGFQCPNCVREGGRTVREARTQFGGRVRQESDVVTKSLIAINVAVFLLITLGGAALVDRLVLIGNVRFVGSIGEPAGVAQGEWYRLLTAAFSHEWLPHLLFNMLALWFFGPPLEAALGRARFLALYLLAALGGTAASYLFLAPNQGSLGASGAIYGLFGAMFVMARQLRFDTRALGILIAVNLVISFTVPSIDWRAHLGGMLTGAGLAAAFAYAPRGSRTVVQVAAVAIALVVIAIVVLARTADIG